MFYSTINEGDRMERWRRKWDIRKIAPIVELKTLKRERCRMTCAELEFGRYEREYYPAWVMVTRSLSGSVALG